jgi:hypothetical protein
MNNYNDLDEEYKKETGEYTYTNMYDVADLLLNDIRKYIKKYHIGYYDLYFEYLENGNKLNKHLVGIKKLNQIITINEKIKKMIINKEFKSLK